MFIIHLFISVKIDMEKQLVILEEEYEVSERAHIASHKTASH